MRIVVVTVNKTKSLLIIPPSGSYLNEKRLLLKFNSIMRDWNVVNIPWAMFSKIHKTRSLLTIAPGAMDKEFRHT